MSEPAVVETTTAHCFKCREKRTYTRLLASKPVFACDGCGSTREIEELGRVEIPGRISPVPPPRAQLPAFVAPKKRTYTNRRQETTVSETTEFKKRSPLQSAIAEAVKEQLEPIRTELAEIRKQLKNLPEASEAEVTTKELDKTVARAIDEKFESDLPELVQRVLLQQLATPMKAGSPSRRAGRTEPAGGADSSGDSCRHKNFMRKCPSCQKKHAEKPE